MSIQTDRHEFLEDETTTLFAEVTRALVTGMIAVIVIEVLEARIGEIGVMGGLVVGLVVGLVLVLGLVLRAIEEDWNGYNLSLYILTHNPYILKDATRP